MSSSSTTVASGKGRGSRLTRVSIPVLGLFWLVVTTLPFIFVVMTSLKSRQETFTSPVWELPKKLNFENYIAVLNGGFWVYLRNSVFVLVFSIVLIDRVGHYLDRFWNAQSDFPVAQQSGEPALRLFDGWHHFSRHRLRPDGR